MSEKPTVAPETSTPAEAPAKVDTKPWLQPHRWKAGQPSPNPKGRPRTGHTLAEAVRRHGDPDELATIVMTIARGQPLVRALDVATGKVVLKKEGDDMKGYEIKEIIWPAFGDMMRAIEFMADRGYFKLPLPIALDVTTHNADAAAAQFDPTKLTTAQLDTWIELQEIASGRSKGAAVQVLEQTTAPKRSQSDE